MRSTLAVPRAQPLAALVHDPDRPPPLPSEIFAALLTRRRGWGISGPSSNHPSSKSGANPWPIRRRHHPFAHQGRGDRLGRPSLHRPQGQVAASDDGLGRDRRGHADRRLHVRRKLDRRLEGDRRIRHDPEAGPRRGLCRPVQRDSDAGPLLQRRRALDRRALRPRSALHRDPRRGVSQADRRRRHGVRRAGGRILHVRRRALRGRYNASGFKIDDIELPTNTMREYEGGNQAHRPRAKGGYFPVAPVDSAMDIRGEMVATMLEMGLPCDKHHHEVAGVAARARTYLWRSGRDCRSHADLQVRRAHVSDGTSGPR